MKYIFILEDTKADTLSYNFPPSPLLAFFILIHSEQIELGCKNYFVHAKFQMKSFLL